MFDRVYPPHGRPRAMLPGSLVVSLAVHAGFFVAVGLSVPVYMTETLSEGIQYFAPVPVRQPEIAGERLSFLELPGGGIGGQAVGPVETFEDGTTADVRGREGADSVEGAGMFGVASLADFPPVNLDSVYFPDEVDNPAAYDPRSRAPAYPDSLQRLGIEGSVTAQFIVDTTGRAADSTLQIIGFTHQPFAQSVRDALPGMLFRPAELQGSKIRQLVQQTFSFRMPSKAADSARATSTSPVPPASGAAR